MRRVIVALALFVSSSCDPPAGDGARSSPTTGARPETRSAPILVPSQTDEGTLFLQGAVFWTDGSTPAAGRPVCVYSHGSPMTPAERQAMAPFDDRYAIRWFAERGYVVVSVLRHGFGTSDGDFEEGVSADRPDYARAGHVAAHDVHAVLDFVQTMPDVDRRRVLLVGHSAGGFASLAVLGEEGVHVRAVIDFAGGKGAQHLASGSTYADRIVAAAAEYGERARAPALWVYADNDSLFPPPIVTRMFDAYRAAGAPAEIERLPAVGDEGHDLFTVAGERLWGSAVEAFLARQGLPSVPTAASDARR